MSFNDFIKAVADEKQRADARELIAKMAQLSGHMAQMWGPSIIRFANISINIQAAKKATWRLLHGIVYSR